MASLTRMDKSLRSLVSRWPVVLGAVIAGFLFAYVNEAKPFVGPPYSAKADTEAEAG